MFKHISKRKRKQEFDSSSDSDSDVSRSLTNGRLQHAEDAGDEEWTGFASNDDASDFGSHDEPDVDEEGSDTGQSGSDTEQDPLERPLVGQPPNLKCVLCPAKTFKSDGDALTHVNSNTHARRKERVQRFLETEEAQPFIEQDDIDGIVALLDERTKNPAAKHEKKKRKRPGRNQRRAIREARENGQTSVENGAADSSSS